LGDGRRPRAVPTVRSSGGRWASARTRRNAPGAVGPGEVTIAVFTYLANLVGRILPAKDEEDGQGLVEYGLILVLIAIVAVVALMFIGGQVSKALSAVGNSV